MSEMKYYIVYGNWKPEYRGPNEFKMAMKEWEKKVNEAGVEIVFWGASLGVPENALCVYKGTPENYLKLLGSDMPYTNTRTNVVIEF